MSSRSLVFTDDMNFVTDLKNLFDALLKNKSSLRLKKEKIAQYMDKYIHVWCPFKSCVLESLNNEYNLYLSEDVRRHA